MLTHSVPPGESQHPVSKWLLKPNGGAEKKQEQSPRHKEDEVVMGVRGHKPALLGSPGASRAGRSRSQALGGARPGPTLVSHFGRQKQEVGFCCFKSPSLWQLATTVPGHCSDSLQGPLGPLYTLFKDTVSSDTGVVLGPGHPPRDSSPARPTSHAWAEMAHSGRKSRKKERREGCR